MQPQTEPLSLPQMTSAPSFPGFDTSAYPGDATMKKWRDASPYRFVAYYLRSPCHMNSGWTGKRSVLVDMGWNVVPVYVGQQVAGVSPCTKSVLTTEQGQADGSDAVAKMAGDGFPAGTFVFLDIERCDVFPPAMGAYARAWVDRVRVAGFGVGIYCHKHNAPDLQPVAGEGARFWIAGGVTSKFDIKTAKPADSGIEFADLWQSPVSVTRTFGGVAISVDEDVAGLISPAEEISS